MANRPVSDPGWRSSKVPLSLDSSKGGEGQEKENSASPDLRKPGCAHKGPGSTGSSVGWVGVGAVGGGGERKTMECVLFGRI